MRPKNTFKPGYDQGKGKIGGSGGHTFSTAGRVGEMPVFQATMAQSYKKNTFNQNLVASGAGSAAEADQHDCTNEE